MFSEWQAAKVRESLRLWIGAETLAEAVAARKSCGEAIAAGSDSPLQRRYLVAGALRCVQSARYAGANEWLTLWNDFCGDLSNATEHPGDEARRAQLQRVTL